MPAMLSVSGTPRKAALVTISLTGIGWLLVVIGFSIAIDKNELLLWPERAPPADRNDPNAYLYWAVCVTGPVMFIAAFAHAVLRQPFSSALGAVASFLTVIFLTGLGMILYWNGDNINIRPAPTNGTFTLPDSFKMEFAGAIIATAFWTLTMVLWHFYDSEQLEHTGTEFLRGRARKIALPFILLAGNGWLLATIGFGIAISKDDLEKDDPGSYSFWVVSVGGPFTVTTALVHAFLNKYSFKSFLEAVTSILNVLFLTGLGMILYINAVIFRENDSGGSIANSFKLMFAGAIVATFSVTLVLILWHFYDFEAKRHPELHHSNASSEARRHQYGSTDV